MAAGLSNEGGRGGFLSTLARAPDITLATWRACAIIVAMGSFGSARSSLKEVNKVLEMLKSKEGDFVRLVILPWERA